MSIVNAWCDDEEQKISLIQILMKQDVSQVTDMRQLYVHENTLASDIIHYLMS